jgi:transcriptional regulator with XRE-family HTH domain
MEKERFGAFVAENRRGLGLTQKDLAEKLHVTDKAVSKWERGLSYPDVTLLEPLAEVFGLGVTELVACRRDAGGEEEVQSLLAISGENVRRERARRQRWVAVLGVLLLAALAALAILLARSTVRETGELYILHTEARGDTLLLFLEKEGHLLRLAYAGADRGDLAQRLEDGYSLQGEYRWNRRSYTGALLRWSPGGIPIGTPMDEVGSATDLYPWDGDALYGFPRVMVKLLSRQPNPWGKGYLSTYIFYRGDDSADWYRHPDFELVRAKNCLGCAAYGDGGFRTADYDGDGVRELLTRTPWPEKPCVVYDWEDGSVTETWLDELPEVMTGPQG